MCIRRIPSACVFNTEHNAHIRTRARKGGERHTTYKVCDVKQSVFSTINRRPVGSCIPLCDGGDGVQGVGGGGGWCES